MKEPQNSSLEMSPRESDRRHVSSSMKEPQNSSLGMGSQYSDDRSKNTSNSGSKITLNTTHWAHDASNEEYCWNGKKEKYGVFK